MTNEVSVPFSSEEDRDPEWYQQWCDERDDCFSSFFLRRGSRPTGNWLIVQSRTFCPVSVPFSSEEDRDFDSIDTLNITPRSICFSSFFLRRGSRLRHRPIYVINLSNHRLFQFLFPPKRIATAHLALSMEKI